MKNSLSIWQLDTNELSVPLRHDEATHLLSALDPSRKGADTLDVLINNGWVCCTVSGAYILTSDGLKIRRKLQDIRTIKREKPETIKKDTKAWTRFRNLVPYYIECVRQQERSQQYLFASDEGKKFFLPTLPNGWLQEIDKAPRQLTIPISPADRVAARTLLTRQEYEEEIYIGYPMEAVHRNNKIFYAPICLIPVEIISHSDYEMVIRLSVDEADLNQQWLEYRMGAEDKNILMQSILRIHDKDEYRGLVDIKEALPFLEHYAKNCRIGMFNPDLLDLSLPHPKPQSSQPCNCAALFVGRELQYSRTLIRELRYIEQESDEVLDQTALACIFRDPPLPAKQTGDLLSLPFISTNDEQQLACQQALNEPLTLVTGPPGTGKSQVAVNIIANLVFRGNSVLFTSRNHKAVHAIADRSMTMIGESAPDLVQFCSLPDGTASQFWYDKDVSLQAAKADASYQPHHDDGFRQVLRSSELWMDASSKIRKREELEKDLSILQQKIEGLERRLNGISNSGRHQDLDAQVLKSITRHLHEAPQKGGLMAFVRCLMWTWMGKKSHDSAWKQLETQSKSLANPYLTIAKVVDSIGMTIEGIRELASEQKSKSHIVRQCREMQEITPLEDYLRSLYEEITPLLPDSLKYSICSAVRDITGSPEHLETLKALKAEFKNQTRLLITQGVNENSVAAGKIKFALFLKVFPAWATTLLSLTRSAPCFPAVFDRVIIDEASQCDIAPIIPALYRAKGAVIVGDPDQFPPVISLRPMRNDYLKEKHKVNRPEWAAWDYLVATAYNIVPIAPIMLRNHYRCHPEIADYFNEAFYHNRLNDCTDTGRLNFPAALGLKTAVDWEDVTNSQSGEIEAAIRRVDALARNHYNGSVGVVTPLRSVAQKLDEALNKYRNRFDGELVVNTVNAFQGGERDVIIFVLGYNHDLQRGQEWYITSEQNRYIYNVAVSRARACLILVGDRAACAASKASLLRLLAEMPRKRKRLDEKPRFDSIWEERLYHAMVKADLHPTPQYHVVGRRLDFALMNDNIKLDIEVDGVRWHTATDGSRKIDDLWRDVQLESAGWQVLRFWVYELEQDMDACVRKILDAFSLRTPSQKDDNTQME